MWTRQELASEARAFAGAAWRAVESQSIVSTLKIVDTLDEQAILERELETSKPAFPAECAGLHFLLATPFRYAPYPAGSRFRRAGQRQGCFYAAELPDTALIEHAFYRVLFFLDSPMTALPRNPLETSAFRVALQATRGINLTGLPLARDAGAWTHLTDYAACQDLADAARAAGIQTIHYRSVRDPSGRTNIAILSPQAFAAPEPEGVETWKVFLRPESVQLVREMPRLTLEVPLSAWRADPRIPARLRA